METCIGYIKTLQDALYVIEACRIGQLNRIPQRLSVKERKNIGSGSIFVWDEKEASMRRWTDSRTWSPSRVLGSFLMYKELNTERRPHKSHYCGKSCIYKENGLIKQSFSIVTNANQKLHLISYYRKQDILSGKLKRPSHMFDFEIQKGIYPDLIQPFVRHGSIDSIPSSSNPSSSPLYSRSICPGSLNDSCFTNQKLLPIQDITWNKLPFTEDKRQLNALETQLRI